MYRRGISWFTFCASAIPKGQRVVNRGVSTATWDLLVTILKYWKCFAVGHEFYVLSRPVYMLNIIRTYLLRVGWHYASLGADAGYACALRGVL